MANIPPELIAQVRQQGEIVDESTSRSWRPQE